MYSRLNDQQQDVMDELVRQYDFQQVGNRTTICILETYSGFEIIGVSSIFGEDTHGDIEDPDIGELCALKDALNQLIKFDSYHLTEVLYENDYENDSESIDWLYGMFILWYRDRYASEPPPKKEFVKYIKTNKYKIDEKRIYGVAFDLIEQNKKFY